MTRLFRSSLVIGLVGWFAAIGCGDDESSDDTSSQGQGGSGAATGSGGAGVGGTGEGGSGAGPGDCTEISVEEFKLVSTFGASTYAGSPMPTLGGAPEDRFVLQIYELEGEDPVTGSVDLAAGIQANFATCSACVLAYEDIPEEGPPAKVFYQAEGTLDLGSSTAPFLVGTLTGLKLIEVTIDAETFESTPVEGGTCLYIASMDVTVEPPPEGWECPPEWYEDAISCDCACGALDVDCANESLPDYGCEEGQTCSADGLVCEGVPTAWTCAPEQYGGGAGNGCDCNCGTTDPDCDIAAEPVDGCQAGEVCNAVGACIPGAWTCDGTYYNDGALCDCGCGVLDVDCADATVGSCAYCDNEGSCSTAACPGTINPANNAICG